VVALVAPDGTVTARYDYDGFGNTIAATGPAAPSNIYRFSTKYHDDETGLIYYGYRYCAPCKVWRFLQDESSCRAKISHPLVPSVGTVKEDVEPNDTV
jgi:RHS repeat-associated protein